MHTKKEFDECLFFIESYNRIRPINFGFQVKDHSCSILSTSDCVS